MSQITHQPYFTVPKTIDATVRRPSIGFMPSVNDLLVALAGCVVMAVAGVGVAAYLMLPFNAVA